MAELVQDIPPDPSSGDLRTVQSKMQQRIANTKERLNQQARSKTWVIYEVSKDKSPEIFQKLSGADHDASGQTINPGVIEIAPPEQSSFSRLAFEKVRVYLLPVHTAKANTKITIIKGPSSSFFKTDGFTLQTFTHKEKEFTFEYNPNCAPVIDSAETNGETIAYSPYGNWQLKTDNPKIFEELSTIRFVFQVSFNNIGGVNPVMFLQGEARVAEAELHEEVCKSTVATLPTEPNSTPVSSPPPVSVPNPRPATPPPSSSHPPLPISESTKSSASDCGVTGSTQKCFCPTGTGAQTCESSGAWSTCNCQEASLVINASVGSIGLTMPFLPFMMIGSALLALCIA
jgi:hypothetical protein